MPNCCNTTKLNCLSDYKIYYQNQQLAKKPKPNFCQQFGSDIRHYSAGGACYYQYTLGYPGIFSILNSHTWVQSAEWYFSIRLTGEPCRGWKSCLLSPAATLFQRLETKIIPVLLHVPPPPTPLRTQSGVMNTNSQHFPARILALQQADVVGLHPEHPTMTGGESQGLSWLWLLSTLVILKTSSWSWRWLPAICASFALFSLVLSSLLFSPSAFFSFISLYI